MKKFLSSLQRAAKIKIDLKPSETSTTKTITINDPDDQHGHEGKTQILNLYTLGDSVEGSINIIPLGKTLAHNGITVELIGEITLYVDTKQTSQFTQLRKDVVPPGTITKETQVEFSFKHVEKEYESYRGINADLRYYIRVTVQRSMFPVIKEQEFWVQTTVEKPSEIDNGIALEVGLEGIVMLSIKYDNVYYDLKNGIIEGKLKFYLVNVNIDKAEVSIIREESIGTGEDLVTDKETLKKFEIIDGTPAKDEIVPVRMFLSSIEPWKLSPTHVGVNNKFSVKYYLHLALCDAKGRRFFKQREIKFFRTSL